MKTKNILKVIGLSISFIVIVSIIVIRSFFLPQVEVGTVEYKMISGNDDGKQKLLLVETAGESIYLDDKFSEKNYDDLLSGKSNFDSINYRISVSLCGVRDDTITLFLDNENYKKVRADTIIKFEIDKRDRDYLVEIIE